MLAHYIPIAYQCSEDLEIEALANEICNYLCMYHGELQPIGNTERSSRFLATILQ
jgi:hypothetical protein